MPEGEAHHGREYEKKNEWGGGKRCREGDGMGDRCETEGGMRRRGRVQRTLTDSQE